MSVQSPEVTREFLIDGLRDAHAMESQAVSLTSSFAERLQHYPDLERRVREHMHETERQRDRVEQCLVRFGTSESTFKDAALKLAANMQAIVHSMTEDEVIKNTLASYAFEQFEIISYSALIEAATLLHEAEVVEVCRQNLGEEQRMAAWIADALPETIRKYLARRSADVESKR